MRTVFLAGGIASGKSTVARALEERGACRIDLDVLSREVCLPGSPTLGELAARFGDDVLDEATGELRREVLARRAFDSEEATAALEAITHPAIFAKLEECLAKQSSAPVCVVEVPLLDRALGYRQLADEVVCVVCPTPLRRERAVMRGMDAEDFDRRDARQPTQEFLERHADTIFANEGDEKALVTQVDAWWSNVTKG